jgi:hypothetical protein
MVYYYSPAFLFRYEEASSWKSEEFEEATVTTKRATRIAHFTKLITLLLLLLKELISFAIVNC